MIVLPNKAGSLPSLPECPGGQGACRGRRLGCKNCHCPIDRAARRPAARFHRVASPTPQQ